MNSVLDTPIFNEASVRSVNFFNGRLLSAEDLNKEKLATLEGRKQLGQAIGDGIAYGLEVTRTEGAITASVTVQPGLAINQRGRTVSLSDAVTLALQPPAATTPTARASSFDDCLPPQSGVYIVDQGIYLLTIAPAEASEGRAQVSGLGNGAAACNVRYKIEAVQFRLISLTEFFTGDLGEPERLRNRVAHRCFGTNDTRLNNIIADPFGASTTSYGLIDDLRANNKLTRCEVPLAVLHWKQTGIQFVDMWSVRRRITKRMADTEHWPIFIADRRVAEAEAVFLQFQIQIEHIRTHEKNLASLLATNRFDFLPPIGIVPISGVGISQGFSYQTFFQGVTYREPVYIEGVLTQALIHEALTYPPIDLSSGEMLWLYWIRENIQLIKENSVSTPQAYLMFVNGHLPYRGNARFDLNRWNYTNYAD